MKEYVEYQGDVEGSIVKYPILKRFLMDGETTWFSADKINEYMGYTAVLRYTEMRSEHINRVLAEAEKRGELNVN